MFTIHGDDERSLEEQCPSCVRKVLLPKSARRGALEFLQFSSLNELSIFPDIVGVASHIRNLVLSERPSARGGGTGVRRHERLIEA